MSHEQAYRADVSRVPARSSARTMDAAIQPGLPGCVARDVRRNGSCTRREDSAGAVEAMNDLREKYEERAAIMHFEGGLPLVKAESLARAEMETWRKSVEKREASE